MISSSEMTEPTTAQAPETVTAEATEIETSRERDGEEEEKIRRQKKLEEALEAKSLRRIISAYLNYPEAAEEDLKKWERSYRKLSPAHKAFEPPIDLSQDLDACEDSNLDCAPHEKYILDERHDSSCQPALTNNFTHEEERKSMHDSELQKRDANGSSPNNYSEDARNNDDRYDCDGGHVIHDHGNASLSSHDWLDPSLQTHVPLVDVDKVRCIIRNIVRDWAAEGQRERDQCYKPILDELDSLFPDRQKKSTPPSCLVPGAGLGRLALEISCLGFISQGNEFSYYMMICSSFILNYAQVPGEWTIYPWIHSNCNSLSDNDQLRPVSIPDIHPARLELVITCFCLDNVSYSIHHSFAYNAIGNTEFSGMWDAVVTCFFIDTAHNIIEYIETISKILKDGGGPESGSHKPPLVFQRCSVFYLLASPHRQRVLRMHPCLWSCYIVFL
ncbi:hypothetical protein F2Q68_00027823 [Brassica cretica]|uniref:Carnosine N-methyltransferase n=1 Tax=Brassica cretica TaxID=69181 RepID=A0A8S9IGF3_BRACR|nr:hypothetical protein F2Q68_00027823 [Brassica cretica]